MLEGLFVGFVFVSCMEAGKALISLGIIYMIALDKRGAISYYTDMGTTRKPHQYFAGYVCELRNQYSGGHTVISDCKRAEEQGDAIVQDYKAEGGRYQVLCNEHGTLVYCTNLPVSRECMKDPTTFCMICRCIAGEGPEDWERTLAPHEVAQVWARKRVYREPLYRDSVCQDLRSKALV